MWLMSQRGFYSIVEDRQTPDHLLVRSRHRIDLENLQSLITGDFNLKERIEETPGRDYPFRVTLPKWMAVQLVHYLAAEIDYGNFKSRVHELPDQANKNEAYMSVWSAMRRSQDPAPRRGHTAPFSDSDDLDDPFDPEEVRRTEVRDSGFYECRSGGR